MKELVPLHDRVIIEPIQEGETMYGNIVIPDMGKERPEMGTVVAIGPGRYSESGYFHPINVKVGDIVLVPKFGAQRIEFDGVEYYITVDKEILCIVNEIEDQTYDPLADRDILE
jgi:chaperonin GroES